jgi:hypothetical protein
MRTAVVGRHCFRETKMKCRTRNLDVREGEGDEKLIGVEGGSLVVKCDYYSRLSNDAVINQFVVGRRNDRRDRGREESETLEHVRAMMGHIIVITHTVRPTLVTRINR